MPVLPRGTEGSEASGRVDARACFRVLHWDKAGVEQAVVQRIGYPDGDDIIFVTQAAHVLLPVHAVKVRNDDDEASSFEQAIQTG